MISPDVAERVRLSVPFEVGIMVFKVMPEGAVNVRVVLKAAAFVKRSVDVAVIEAPNKILPPPL